MDGVGILSRSEADRDVRARVHGEHGLHEIGRAGGDPVHVERRVREGAEVELLGRARPDRDGAVVGQLVVARRQLSPCHELLVGGRRRADAEVVGEAPVRPWENARQCGRQRVCRVECRRTEHPGVHVRRPRADMEVEVEHPADRHGECGLPSTDHPAVEDQSGIRTTGVGSDPFDDRVAPDLLLAVEGEADVDRQLAGGCELPDGLDEHEEVPLVVGDAARVEPAVSLRQLERRGLPELERVRRLDVEVRVAEDRRSSLGALRRGELADDERPRAPGYELGRPTAVSDARGDPLRGSGDVCGVRRIGAHGGDGDQLGERVAELVGRRRHGRAVYAEPVGRVPLGDVADALGIGERAELLQPLVLDLPDALARDVECASHLVERSRLATVEPVPQLEHHALPLREVVQDRAERLTLQRRLGELVRERGRLVGEEVAELGLVVVADGLLERDRHLRATTNLLDLVRRHLDVARDLVDRRLPTELGAELALGAHDPVELLDDVHGHPDRPALVRDRARDRLPDPPRRVRRELEALAVVELLGGADETDRALLDEVEERQALVAVSLGDRDDEAKVRLHHGLLRGVLAALDALRQLDLLRRRQQRDLADVLEEELQGVGRDLRLGLDRGLRLVGVGMDDRDLRLLERGVEVVELRGLQLELVERERELVCIDLARSVPALEQPLALVAGEDLLDRRSSGSALRIVSGQTAPLPRRPSHGSYSCGGRQRPARRGSRASPADRREVALRLARQR